MNVEAGEFRGWDIFYAGKDKRWGQQGCIFSKQRLRRSRQNCVIYFRAVDLDSEIKKFAQGLTAHLPGLELEFVLIDSTLNGLSSVYCKV